MISTASPPIQPRKAIFPTPEMIDFLLQITIKEDKVRGDEELQEGFIMLASCDDGCLPGIPCAPSAGWWMRPSLR